ncbi:MAG: hypothetical protein O2895_06040 [Chloroflexi bacterium]|nr:hypothetical protein [Chloroflexota bacterium]
MVFAMMLGLVLGGAVVLLIEQWLRAELRTLPQPSRRLGPRSSTPLLSGLSGPRRRSLF